MDEPMEDGDPQHCPTCTGSRVRWRVKRQTPGRPRGGRNPLEWSCLDCGAVWDDSPRDQAGAAPDPMSPGGPPWAR